MGGSVLTERGVTVADVIVENGRIVAIGPDVSAAEDRVIDAAGSWVGPGFVDVHVHLRE
ncbi:MAG: hypothetical protein IIB04_02045, partial [Acidobacteria bacterium]|nr:hypothetical protein [Acidobacteriota bacterium]